MDLDNVIYVVASHDGSVFAACETHADAEEFALAMAEERMYYGFLVHLKGFSVEDYFIERHMAQKVNRLETLTGYLLLSAFHPIIEPVARY